MKAHLRWRCIVVALVAAAIFQPVNPQAAFRETGRLQDILEALSNESSTKNPTFSELQNMFADLGPNDRREAVDWLIDRLTKGGDSTRYAAALALSKTGIYWEASNHSKRIDDICKLMNAEKDARTKRALDDAISSASGLYLEGIRDYNLGRVSDVDGSAKKISAISTICPSSRYASNSAFYEAMYYVRAARIIPANKADYLNRSNKLFDAFTARSEKGDFVSNQFMLDGYYYRALNSILLGNVQATLKDLGDLKEKKLSKAKDRLIYVDQFFYVPRESSTVLDAFVPADKLVDETVAFIKKDEKALPDKQIDLVRRLQSVLRTGQ